MMEGSSELLDAYRKGDLDALERITKEATAASTTETTAPDAMSREAYKRLRRMNKSELSAYICRVWLDAYKTGYQDGARNAKK